MANSVRQRTCRGWEWGRGWGWGGKGQGGRAWPAHASSGSNSPPVHHGVAPATTQPCTCSNAPPGGTRDVPSAWCVRQQHPRTPAPSVRPPQRRRPGVTSSRRAAPHTPHTHPRCQVSQPRVRNGAAVVGARPSPQLVEHDQGRSAGGRHRLPRLCHLHHEGGLTTHEAVMGTWREGGARTPGSRKQQSAAAVAGVQVTWGVDLAPQWRWRGQLAHKLAF